jgi:hypothetical protein
LVAYIAAGYPSVDLTDEVVLAPGETFDFVAFQNLLRHAFEAVVENPGVQNQIRQAEIVTFDGEVVEVVDWSRRRSKVGVGVSLVVASAQWTSKGHPFASFVVDFDSLASSFLVADGIEAAFPGSYPEVDCALDSFHPQIVDTTDWRR